MKLINYAKWILFPALCASSLPVTGPLGCFGQPPARTYGFDYTLDTHPFVPDYHLDWYDYDWSLGDEGGEQGKSSDYLANREKRLSQPGLRLLRRSDRLNSLGYNGRRYFSSPSIRSGGVNPQRYLQNSPPPPDPRETLSGRVMDFRILRSRDAQGDWDVHYLAKLRLQNGGTALVDLGWNESRMRDLVNRGDQIMALGRSRRIDDRQVMMADRILVHNKVYDVGPRPSGLSLNRLIDHLGEEEYFLDAPR